MNRPRVSRERCSVAPRPESFRGIGLTYIRFVAKGMRAAEIGDQLNISRRTVEFRCGQIYKKCGAHSMAAVGAFILKEVWECVFDPLFPTHKKVRPPAPLPLNPATTIAGQEIEI